MKWIVFATLIIALIIGLIIMFSLGKFIKELKDLSHITKYNCEGEPSSFNDGLYYFLFLVFLVYNLLTLVSCTIIVLQ